LPELKKALAAADAAALLARMEKDKAVTLDLPGGQVTLDAEDLQIRLQAKEGWAAAQGAASVVVLSTELSDELVAEGLARELVHTIQTQRKDLGCEYTDRIAVGLETSDEPLVRAAEQFRDYIQSETLAVRIARGPIAGAKPLEVKLAGLKFTLYVQVVPA
jgi:isoleucyl-tRNA synthetase